MSYKITTQRNTVYSFMCKRHYLCLTHLTWELQVFEFVLVTVRGFTSFFEISTISCALLMEKNQAEKTVNKLRSTSHFCLCELLDGNEEGDHHFVHACVKLEYHPSCLTHFT